MSAKRLLFIAVMIILLAAGIAMAVAGGPAKTSASGLAAYGGSAGQPSVADTSAATTAQTSAGASLDPAKQEPVLDQFVSKDPFDMSTLSGATSTPTPTTTKAMGHSRENARKRLVARQQKRNARPTPESSA